MKDEIDGRVAFLWVDRQTDQQRRNAYEELQRGDIVISRLETRENGASIKIPDGLVHHWIGTFFIPGASLERVTSLMQDYERYATVYRPNVRRSRTLARDGDRFRVYLQLFMKKVISVVLNSEYDVRYVRVAPQRMHVRSFTTRIAEVDDPDTPREREKPVGRDNGFLWRFNKLLLARGARRRHLRAMRVDLAQPRDSDRPWLARPAVRDRHPQRIAGVHARKDALNAQDRGVNRYLSLSALRRKRRAPSHESSFGTRIPRPRGIGFASTR
jgi:hypothetical protein